MVLTEAYQGILFKYAHFESMETLETLPKTLYKARVVIRVPGLAVLWLGGKVSRYSLRGKHIRISDYSGFSKNSRVSGSFGSYEHKFPKFVLYFDDASIAHFSARENAKGRYSEGECGFCSHSLSINWGIMLILYTETEDGIDRRMKNCVCAALCALCILLSFMFFYLVFNVIWYINAMKASANTSRSHYVVA